MRDPSESTIGLTCVVDGAWGRLNQLELRANAKISGQLANFEGPFQDTYEAGVIVPALRPNSRIVVDVSCAALFLKRVLNDLRGVWILLHSGYTSQAASVAASLYENALATICLTLSAKNISVFLSKPDGEIPWAPMEMAKMAIRGEGEKPNTEGYENGWRSLYAHYVWLCQIKHSTRQSVVHDTGSSAVNSEGYVVMALPDCRPEDIGVKAMVGIISLHRTLEAIQAFAAAVGLKDETPDHFKFSERLKRARTSAWQAFMPHAQTVNPISIHRSWFPKKYPLIKI